MKLMLTSSLVLLAFAALAQNVGIGTSNPTRLLSVNGTVLVDAGNMNTGAGDSASLRFGTNGMAAISSNKAVAGVNTNGLDFWTNNNRRMIINTNGFVGINNNEPAYRLDVGGTIHTSSSLFTDGGAYISGSGNVEGNTYLNSSAYIADYMGIGTSFSSTYRLNVNGNALIGTNLGVNGTIRVDGAANLNSTLTVDGKLTNEGRAIMLSNSSTTLRSGFSNGTFTIALNAGQATDIPFIIPTFTGNNNNVRVMVAQLVPGTGASNWGGVVFTPHSIDPTDAAYSNASTVRIRMQNTSSTIANLGTNAVLYLFTVVTH
jgi:hypothetical protein